MAKRMLAAVVILLTSAGCAALRYAPDAERAVYLAAKDSTYCLWRFDVVCLDEMRRARAPLEALHAALSAETDAEVDAALGEFLFARIDSVAGPRDRDILRELTAAALDDLQFDPAAPGAPAVRDAAVLVVGGILDGIAYSEKAAGERR